MFFKLPLFSLLLISPMLANANANANATVYRCEKGETVSFSSQPCENILVNTKQIDHSSEHYYSPTEQFIAPIYLQWKKGWTKSKNVKFERFSEVEFEPVEKTVLNKSMRINLQKLTELPQSMTVSRFSASVEDILESLCSNTLFLHTKIAEKNIDDVFYGQYACSYRRDTQQGELGHYKIIRGENSIYMVTIKWDIEAFDIKQEASFKRIKSQQQVKFNNAQHYLQNEVKLCKDGGCL